MDFGCPAGRDAGKYLDADGAKRGADVVAQRVHRACGGRTGCGRAGCRRRAGVPGGERNAVEGAGSATATESSRLADLRPFVMWMGANIRRVAHTVEFFFVGLFASLVAVCLGECLPCARMLPVRTRICSFAPSALSATKCTRSLFLVSHFDIIDLGFDAAGYVTAMLLVLLVAALAAARDLSHWRPCETLAVNKLCY